MTPERRRVYDAMLSEPRRSPPVGLLAVAMHRPELAETMSALGLALRFNPRFEQRPRKFAIMGRIGIASSNGRPTRGRRARRAFPRPPLRR